MNVQSIIENFAHRGIRLIADGDGVIVEPASKLTNQDRELIRQHKPAILATLTMQDTLPRGSVNLEAIADAIAARPRSPIENDLALSRVARAAVEAGRIVRTLPGAARSAALSLCAERSKQASDYILQRNYESAYLILDTLPKTLASLRPQ